MVEEGMELGYFVPMFCPLGMRRRGRKGWGELGKQLPSPPSTPANLAFHTRCCLGVKSGQA